MRVGLSPPLSFQGQGNLEISDNQKYSVPQKAWLAVLLGLLAWAAVILVAIAVSGYFRGESSAGQDLSSVEGESFLQLSLLLAESVLRFF